MKDHYWEYCDLCEREVIICGKCGNNTCNGGTGTVDGENCDQCDEAYNIFLMGMKQVSTGVIEVVELPVGDDRKSSK